MVAIIGIICIGPKELPTVMRTVGRWIRQLRQTSGQWMAMLEEDKASNTQDNRPATTPKPPHIIHDDEGRAYEAYDLSDLQPIKPSQKDL